ncbi:GIY-YIG nuclease family protein [Candidatus Roizmanbacteria bacterium]|nr:GIY-YIG nuclease family protein [Candidatus Roizmanbacteria bacterium]
MTSHCYYTYILASNNNGTLYIGVTNNLERRLCEHKNGLVPGFTKHYAIHRLVYYEEYHSVDEAIAREKQVKNWHWEWKYNLIREKNPLMKDLSAQR